MEANTPISNRELREAYVLFSKEELITVLIGKHDYQKVIYAGGSGDEERWPQEGIEEVKNNFKQEEINRLGRPL